MKGKPLGGNLLRSPHFIVKLAYLDETGHLAHKRFPATCQLGALVRGVPAAELTGPDRPGLRCSYSTGPDISGRRDLCQRL